MKLSKNKGFTLIELLVVIGIIAILATIVLIAINPARQFSKANNTQRTSNVNAILNAIGQKIVDGKGSFNSGSPTCPALPATSTEIKVSVSGGIDLVCLVPTYISSIPFDPTGSASSTGYFVFQDSTSKRVTVKAPSAELGEVIEVSR